MPQSPRLCLATLDRLAPEVRRFAYDREAVRGGVVHFGPGAFHRAHQAWFFDRLLASDPRWGICGVALKSPTLPGALTPQDGLYVLAELEREARFELVGALTEVLFAPAAETTVRRRLRDPATRWVGLTVTEKGYGLTAAGALDETNPDIAHDLARPEDTPASAIGWILAGLADRRAAGRRPFVVASCDNLPSNGRRLRAGVLEMARRRDPALAAWIEGEVRFPCSMVDSITPAADDALLARVEAAAGLRDAAPVQREAFCQWVIEDDLGPDAPDLGSVGVTLTDDVEGYEAAKLRLLNAAHSSLAYLGLLRGRETVAEAMADPELATFARGLMAEAIAPLLRPPKGLDLPAYIDAILARFANPAIRHRLAQIAMDGSQKLPIRLLPSVRQALDAGRPLDRLVLPLAAWTRFLAREFAAGRPVQDPLAARLAAALHADPDFGLLAISEVFPADLAQAPAFRAAFANALASLA
ncbi:MAG TPA: mannitol dehydrogenase family protein [Caulobacteraceae bacterium]|nr:mannitol dehydrogenase family protein [Caulobacteraceae bacterium]